MTGSACIDPGLLVLHALRCAGYCALPRLAASTGLSLDEVESELIDLAVEGLVERPDAALGAWGLTDAGRAADGERIAAEMERAGARPAVEGAFDRFLVLNPELLDLSTAWQLRPVDGQPVVNDHSDAAYDARVLSRFGDLHERLRPVCADLEAVLPRFGRYPARLARALGLARAGELKYLTDTTDSYHVVWAELHEDLLATLRIPRWGQA